MSVVRIELTERVVIPPDQEDVEYADNLKLPKPKAEVKYRRIFPRVDDIFAPMEVPGITKYCEIEFTDGSSVFVKGSYDEICILLNDRENGKNKAGDEDDVD
jgi:hypothetical protein